MHKKSAIVIGAGIVGIATARALAIRNYDVTVIERNHKSDGASVRNFGMVWPIGQPEGPGYDQAILSRKIWLDTAAATHLWYNDVGSLHLAYENDEMSVLQELADIYQHRQYRLLTAKEVINKSPAVAAKGLLGGLFSPNEVIIDPREAIEFLPDWLSEQFGVKYLRGCVATEIRYPSVTTGLGKFSADVIYVCNGADFETLYPTIFRDQPITRCKLQMLKVGSQPGNWRIGPALCGGLSLLHYSSFKSAASLPQLRSRMESTHPDYIKCGIHIMVAQNRTGELIIGDSHEYGLSPDPFNRSDLNHMIMDYLRNFAPFKDDTIVETWNGVYAKMLNGKSNLVLTPEQGVTIINGLGGAGMTLSFGLTEQVISGMTA